VPQPWDSNASAFASADFDNVILTAGNFFQYRSPTLSYEGPWSYTSPVDSTLSIIDWVSGQEPGVRIYIYENWPDMSPFGDYPASASEHEAYKERTLGSFHDWWLDYHDAVLDARPSVEIKMIPVGPTIAKILTEAVPDISVTELYEDDSPHGRPTIYFLASLVTYMGMHEARPPDSYAVPDIVHSDVRNNMTAIVDLIWNELSAFNDDQGKSRVW
jgi:hypothetical protein